MDDVLVIGGGVIGLSLAWELSQKGQRVHVVDQGTPGREASWAGAGIIPAAVRRVEQHPYEQLRGMACDLAPRWAQELLAATGIDNGYRRCGALHIARRAGEAASLVAWAALEREDGVELRQLSAEEVLDVEPGIRTQDSKTSDAVPLRAAFFVPGEAQLRNPRHLRALLEACRRCGVTVSADARVTEITSEAGRITAVQTAAGPLVAKQYCVTAGAWAGRLLARLGIATGILPIRGQMALFRCERPLIQRIINEGSRYLVPRDDGHVLVGSTEEEAGFDKRTTTETIEELVQFARELVPALEHAEIEQTWAGLRPGSFDGLPYLGRLPGLENGYVAAGHFRSGLYLATATAVVMRQLMLGEQPEIDLSPFRVGR